MYGEVDFTNKSEQIMLTKQNKIALPEFTKAEAYESVLLMYDFRMEKLLICKADENAILKNYAEALDRLLAAKKITAKTHRKYQRYIHGKLYITTCKLDSKKSIKLPQKVIEKLKFTGTVFAIGTKTFLEIYKDEETYQRSRKN